MRYSFYSSFFLAAVLANSSSTYAQDAPLWKNVGTWQIRVDTTLDYGCFAANFYEGNTMLRLGTIPSTGNAYIILGDTDWKSLEVGKEYDLVFRFDSLDPWSGTASALNMGDNLIVLFTNFSDFDFIDEFMKRHTLRVGFKNRNVATLSLSGSYKAVTELATCQETMRAAGEPGNERDPFATPRRSGDDPFM